MEIIRPFLFWRISSGAFRHTAGMEDRKTVARVRRDLAVREIKNMVFVFALVSFLGWCTEMLACYPFSGWQDRGFLTLPFCTIYGTAAVFYYYAFGLPQSARFFGIRVFPGNGAGNAALRYVYYFLVTAFLAAALEYITALFFDSAFSVRLWYYDRYAFNLAGYVSLGFSLLWGALSTAFMRLGFKPALRLACLVPERTMTALVAVIAVALLADYAFNYIFLIVNGYRFVLF